MFTVDQFRFFQEGRSTSFGSVSAEALRGDPTQLARLATAAGAVATEMQIPTAPPEEAGTDGLVRAVRPGSM